MIDLYTWATPNGYKISIMLEEASLPYKVFGVDIAKGDQFRPEFLKISPNNKIPAIVDHDGPNGKPFGLFESGAILLYLAEKSGCFLPTGADRRFRVIEWLMFQVGGLGPMLGQAHHFRQYAPQHIDYAIDRYTSEAGRLYSVMDRRLGEVEYLAGEYSIADIACFPWISSYRRQGQNLADFPNLERWFEAIETREAVKKGMQVLAEHRVDPSELDEDAKNILFGERQFEKR